MGYYNGTEKMKGVRMIIDSFENIRKVQDIRESGLGGLQIKDV